MWRFLKDTGQWPLRDYLRRLVDLFQTGQGGSWLYVEIDPGFPFANIEALFQAVMELRRL